MKIQILDNDGNILMYQDISNLKVLKTGLYSSKCEFCCTFYHDGVFDSIDHISITEIGIFVKRRWYHNLYEWIYSKFKKPVAIYSGHDSHEIVNGDFDNNLDGWK